MNNGTNLNRFLRLLSYRILAICLLWLYAAVNVHAAEITVTADRETVHLDESFSLIFQVRGSPDGDPDFDPLRKDFEILNRGQSSNISIINGEYTKLAQWHLTVLPRKAGKLVVPPISFGNDASESIVISVNQAVSSHFDPQNGRFLPSVFLETEIEPENPYVQAQVIFTVRLLHRVNLSQAQLSEPQASEAIIEKLGNDVSYNTVRQGQQYRVVERKYAIFPQESGIMMIEALELSAQILEAGRRRGSMFDDFFNRRPTQTKRVRSKPIAVKVKPIPAEFAGTYWLPAEQFSMTDGWADVPLNLSVGEPITRTIKIEAKGLTLSQLPELESVNQTIQAVDGGEIKQYPDKPSTQMHRTAKGLVSTRQEKIALIPSNKGQYKLPAVEIPWWNTKTDRMEIARIPERTLKTHDSEIVKNSGFEAAPVYQQSDSNAPTSATIVWDDTEKQSIWPWISFALALGWLFTLVIWWIRSRKPKGAEKAYRLDSPDKRAAIRSLKSACKNNNPKKARTALLVWAKAVWADSPPANLSEIGRLCDDRLDSEINVLNYCLYSDSHSAWQGQSLWIAFPKNLKGASISVESSDIDLKPLYKI